MSPRKTKPTSKRKLSTGARVLLGLGLLALSGYLCGAAWLYFQQESFIFPQTVQSITPPDADKPTNLAYVTLTTPPTDGEVATLNGLMFTATEPSPTLVIAFGGNAHDVTGMVRFLHDKVFPEDNVTVAGFSYRGYPNALGRPSTGHPSQKRLEADARLIYDSLTERLKPKRVITIGYSLGTAMATHLATQRDVSNLILAAPFSSIARLAHDAYPMYPTWWLLKHPFNTEDIIQQAASTAATTVVYSTTDGLIPGSHIKLLHEKAPNAEFVELIPPIRHGEVLNHPQIPQIFREAAGF